MSDISDEEKLFQAEGLMASLLTLLSHLHDQGWKPDDVAVMSLQSARQFLACEKDFLYGELELRVGPAYVKQIEAILKLEDLLEQQPDLKHMQLQFIGHADGKTLQAAKA